MRALTLSQPWADAIAYGGKRIENRTWAPPSPATGQQLAIHAGRRNDPAARRLAPADWPDARGAIIATAILTGSHPATPGCCTSPWAEQAPGVHHWTLTHISPLPTPVHCPGRQRLWTIPAPIAQEIRDQLG